MRDELTATIEKLTSQLDEERSHFESTLSARIQAWTEKETKMTQTQLKQQ